MTPSYSQRQMEEQRLVRYGDLRPCTTAFIDTRTPGNQKENFTIIGPGVAENPEQHVHIELPHGFNIGAVRQEPHCVNSQHTHETAEVFIIQNSEWAFRWGVDGDEGEVVLGPGAVISIPTQLFRGFENIGGERGFMCAVLGGDDPGQVIWAPKVLEKAREYGLVLLEDGRLIDTGKGETVPAGAKPMPPASDEFVSSMRSMSVEDMAACAFTDEDRKPQTDQTESAIGRIDGVMEVPVIGDGNPAENIPAGKMTWPHGFHLRYLEIQPGGVIDLHRRKEEEVIYIYEGALAMEWQEGALTLNQGDVLTVPIDLPRRYSNTSDCALKAFVVRGGDHPAAPQFVDA